MVLCRHSSSLLTVVMIAVVCLSVVRSVTFWFLVGWSSRLARFPFRSLASPPLACCALSTVSTVARLIYSSPARRDFDFRAGGISQNEGLKSNTWIICSLYSWMRIDHYTGNHQRNLPRFCEELVVVFSALPEVGWVSAKNVNNLGRFL